jgi:parvulin-like peptidyl-prolyl isomerase
MTEDLDFSLDQPKQRRSLAGGLGIILLLAILAVGGVNLWLLSSKGAGKTTTDTILSADQLEELAGRLAARNFHDAAAQTWREYLETASLGSEEKAKVLYRMGDLLLKAEKPREAAAYFYRSEMVKKIPELENKINVKIKECFEKAGEFAALRYEIMERTQYQPTEDTAEKVVASIGPEKITAIQLDTLLEEQVDAQLGQLAEMMSPQQLKTQKETMMAQLSNPQTRMQLVQSIVAQEALYREAMARKLDEDIKVAKRMRQINRQFWAQQLLEKETAGKIHISETDMQTYYQANKAKYIIPAKAQISHIQLASEQDARKAKERLDNGEDFAKLADELSLDETTKATGGEIATDIVPGGNIPGIGRPEQLEEKIFAAGPDTILAEPVKGEKGWHIIKVRTAASQQQQPFEQVKDQIYKTLYSQKLQDFQQKLIEELMDKYDIVIHQGEIMNETPGQIDNEKNKEEEKKEN